MKFELPLFRVFVGCTLRCGLSGWRCRWSEPDPERTLNCHDKSVTTERRPAPVERTAARVPPLARDPVYAKICSSSPFCDVSDDAVDEVGEYLGQIDTTVHFLSVRLDFSSVEIGADVEALPRKRHERRERKLRGVAELTIKLLGVLELGCSCQEAMQQRLSRRRNLTC